MDTEMQSTNYRIINLLMVCAFCFVGCATYKQAASPSQMSERTILSQETFVSENNIDIHFAPIDDKHAAKEYLGLDPYKSKMLPVLLKITNNTNDIIKVDLGGSFVVTRAGEMHGSLSIDEAIKRALRSDAEVVGWAVGFGIVGALAAGSNAASVNRSLEEDYHDKYFKPTLLNIGSTAQGIVFFDFPVTAHEVIRSVVLQFSTLGRNEKKRITVMAN